MKKIIIFGSNGGLGTELKNLLKNYLITAIDKKKIDFSNQNSKPHERCADCRRRWCCE